MPSPMYFAADYVSFKTFWVTGLLVDHPIVQAQP
jgi:hypothetical protein